MSRAWGWLTSTKLPSYVRPWLYSRYANSFGVDLDECANDDLTSYASLAEFFVRELKDGSRPIDPGDLVRFYGMKVPRPKHSKETQMNFY